MSVDTDRVVALHLEGKANCAQAMLMVYGKYCGVSEELAMKLAAGFGGGMGGMGKPAERYRERLQFWGLPMKLTIQPPKQMFMRWSKSLQKDLLIDIVH